MANLQARDRYPQDLGIITVPDHFEQVAWCEITHEHGNINRCWGLYGRYGCCRRWCMCRRINRRDDHDLFDRCFAGSWRRAQDLKLATQSKRAIEKQLNAIGASEQWL